MNRYNRRSFPILQIQPKENQNQINSRSWQLHSKSNLPSPSYVYEESPVPIVPSFLIPHSVNRNTSIYLFIYFLFSSFNFRLSSSSFLHHQPHYSQQHSFPHRS